MGSTTSKLKNKNLMPSKQKLKSSELNEYPIKSEINPEEDGHEPEPVLQKELTQETEKQEVEMTNFDDDFDFIEQYSEEAENETTLPENSAISPINIAFVGIGGGGGKIAKEFIKLGFSKTIIVNTSEKEKPKDVDDKHFVFVSNEGGLGKDPEKGRKVLNEYSSVVEDALRTKIGQVDYICCICSSGGGTGTSSYALHNTISRYLSSIEAEGHIFYVATKPTAQEMLNPRIKSNYSSLMKDLKNETALILDNEKQMKSLRNKVGVSGLYPTANKIFAKMFSRVLSLANESSDIQSFDKKDLEIFLKTKGRMLIGTSMTQFKSQDLGTEIYQNCVAQSPCPKVSGKAKTGVLLSIMTNDMANSPEIATALEAANSYIGGRSDTLFSGVYISEAIKGLASILCLSGLEF